MGLRRYACLTDTGRVREHNEDAYACVPEKGLWVVADGMGGHEAGELASAIVTSHVIQQVQSGATPAEALESAHQAILDAAGRGEGSPRMGCTAVVLQLILFWVAGMARVSPAYCLNPALPRPLSGRPQGPPLRDVDVVYVRDFGVTND